MPLLGQDKTFYTLLEEQAGATVGAAQALQTFCENPSRGQQAAEEAAQMEQTAEAKMQQYIEKVDATFVTPLDKDDLHALALSLNTATGRIATTISRIAAFGITETSGELKALAALIVQSTQIIRESVGSLSALHQKDTIRETMRRLFATSKESKAVLHQAITALFAASSVDPLTVMKWKEIYDRMELVVEECRHIGTVIESVVIKYA